jgi:hypothetical protein
MGEIRKAYIILVGKPERKRPLGRPRPRLEDNIRIDQDGKLWIRLIWLRTETSGGFL